MRISRIDRKNGQVAEILSADEFRAIIHRLEEPEFVDEIFGQVAFLGGGDCSNYSCCRGTKHMTIDCFRNPEAAEAAAYEAGRDAKGDKAPVERFRDWLRHNVHNCGNLDIYFLEKQFGLGYQGKPAYVHHEGRRPR